MSLVSQGQSPAQTAAAGALSSVWLHIHAMLVTWETSSQARLTQTKTLQSGSRLWANELCFTVKVCWYFKRCYHFGVLIMVTMRSLKQLKSYIGVQLCWDQATVAGFIWVSWFPFCPMDAGSVTGTEIYYYVITVTPKNLCWFKMTLHSTGQVDHNHVSEMLLTV